MEVREIKLSHKPPELLLISPKATVPVLQLSDRVVHESLDIMRWALHQNDPQGWLLGDGQKTLDLIARNDGEFKYYLDRYKYADRFPEYSQLYYRQQAELFLNALEGCLSVEKFLCAEFFTLADAAILPFVRQFASVEQSWFAESHFTKVNAWLNRALVTPLFLAALQKYPVWQPGSEAIYLCK